MTTASSTEQPPPRGPRLLAAPGRPTVYDRIELVVLVGVLLLALFTPATTPDGRHNAPFMGTLEQETGGGLCLFRRWTQVDCAGCGLTRGFVQLAHARPLEAVRLNPLTPFLFAWVVGLAIQALCLNLTRKRLDLGFPHRLRWAFYSVGFGVYVVVLVGRLGSGFLGWPDWI